MLQEMFPRFLGLAVAVLASATGLLPGTDIAPATPAPTVGAVVEVAVQPGAPHLEPRDEPGCAHGNAAGEPISLPLSATPPPPTRCNDTDAPRLSSRSSASAR